MPHEVIMPALGMTQDSGVIVAWRKAKGDPVAIGDPLFDVETDKTTMEVEATHAGTLTEIRASTGADIPVGHVIATISASSEVPTGASSDTESNLAPEMAKAVPAGTEGDQTAIAPKPPVPPTPRDKLTAPSTPLAVQTEPTRILASPKAKLQAHRRGINLRQLVDQGIAQPFHVTDLDRLQTQAVTAAAPPVMSQLSAMLDLQALDGFVSWVEERTGSQKMRDRILAVFAAAAFRSVNASDFTISVLSIRGGERALRNPDFQGLSIPNDSAAESGSERADLALVDLTSSRLTNYRPPAQSGRPTVVLTKGDDNGAVATLHFCEDGLPLLNAARFLESFAERIEVPALQLL